MSRSSAPDPTAKPEEKAGARDRIWRLILFLGVFFLLLTAQEGCYQKVVKLPGVVVEKVYSPGTSRTGSGTTSSPSRHEVRYRFTTPQGETKEGLSDVLLGNWSKLHDGDTVRVEYLPATGDSRIAGQTTSAQVFLAIALTLLGGGLFLRRSSRQVSPPRCASV